MKKCPFCKAEIEDNAVFCLYCMTSLEEKQKINLSSDKATKKRVSLIIFITIILLLGISLLVFTLFPINNSTPDHGNSSADDAISQSLPSENATDNQSTPQINDKSPASNVSKQDKVESATNPAPQEGKPKQETSVTESPDGESTNRQPTESAQSPPAYSNATYSYRQAKSGDDFYVHYPLSENDIVITGVLSPSADGKYIIPSTIEGKNVLAISALAFSDPNICNTVRQVVVPNSVKTIWNNAFANCKNLTDIYLCSNSIYIETNAFSSQRNGTLTIHCSANCQDRNYRYYKNSAEYYGAQYSEWNGGGYN